MRNVSPAVVVQPAPRKVRRHDVRHCRPVWDLVIEDMHHRNKCGAEKYGTPLLAFNGRDVLIDAYQEALDLVVYLRQAIEEQEAGR
jgi:hypothetical protein